MLIRIDTCGSVQALSGMLAEVAASSDVGLVMVLACDANGFTPALLDGPLAACGKPLIGGIFPQIMQGRETLQRGTIVAGLRCQARVVTVPAISEASTHFDQIIEQALPQGADAGTMLVFVDGLARRIGALIESLFNNFGLEIDYIGGGAGSLSLRQSPCILTNQGLLMDAAVLALTDSVAGIGVAHGWESISGPYKVTESDRNSILSLDWRPAFEVYREVVEAHANQRFADVAFFDLAKAYPFGIAKLDSEMVVRDPLIAEGDALVCVGEVPQGAYVHILHGDPATLVAAAAHAGRRGAEAYPRAPDQATMLFVDCISRVLFLEDGFAAELDAVNRGIPLIGALTLGEIANSGRDFIEFYNKTSVVGLLDA
jgi:hypothetical protein